MIEQRKQNIRRLTEVLSAEQIAGALIGTLEGIAECKGNDKVEYVNRRINSIIDVLSKKHGGKNND